MEKDKQIIFETEILKEFKNVICYNIRYKKGVFVCKTKNM